MIDYSGEQYRLLDTHCTTVWNQPPCKLFINIIAFKQIIKTIVFFSNLNFYFILFI